MKPPDSKTDGPATTSLHCEAFRRYTVQRPTALLLYVVKALVCGTLSDDRRSGCCCCRSTSNPLPPIRFCELTLVLLPYYIVDAVYDLLLLYTYSHLRYPVRRPTARLLLPFHIEPAATDPLLRIDIGPAAVLYCGRCLRLAVATAVAVHL